MCKSILLIPFMTILVSGLIFGGCAAQPTPLPSTTAPTRILMLGTLGPETGFAAPWHMPEARNTILWAEEVNAVGGLEVGGEKYKVEVIREDDKLDPTQSRAAAEKLVNRDKINILLGPLGLACVRATVPMLTDNNIVNISASSGPAIGPQWPHAFRWITGFEVRIPATFEFARKKLPNIKSIAIFNPRNENGLSDQSISAAIAKEYKWNVVYNEVFEPGTKDFRPYLAKMVAQKPDLIHLGQASVGEVGLQLKQLYEIGYRGYKITGDTDAPEDLIPVCGIEAAEGLVTPGGVPSEPPFATPAAIAHREKYIKRWGNWDSEGVKSEFVPRFLQAALKNAKSLNTNEIVTALEKTVYESPIQGKIYCGGKKAYGINHYILQRMTINTIRNGKNALEQYIEVKDLEAALDKMTPEQLGIKK